MAFDLISFSDPRIEALNLPFLLTQSLLKRLVLSHKSYQAQYCCTLRAPKREAETDVDEAILSGSRERAESTGGLATAEEQSKCSSGGLHSLRHSRGTFLNRLKTAFHNFCSPLRTDCMVTERCQ